MNRAEDECTEGLSRVIWWCNGVKDVTLMVVNVSNSVIRYKTGLMIMIKEMRASEFSSLVRASQKLLLRTIPKIPF
jgi:hypothetical protein